MSIGIAGSHRVGKTSLAEAVSQETGLPFVRTSISEVAKTIGIHPADDLDFQTRMRLQNAILESLDRQWETEKRTFVSDRTALDFIAYTLADIGVGKAGTEIEWKILEQYINRCFEVNNRHFAAIVVLQPGIPIVDDPTKVIGAMNRSYIEHLNTLMLGVASDQRCTSASFRVRREWLSMEDRVRCVLAAWKVACERMAAREGDVFH